ncbi:hypothetical protein [Mucilaginibacter terrae]|uniref:Uncharacterized protein n=1 Tax=Mucilaginibacter terrae TaxID=1955052 RepID=A0ABU3GXY5_9SPHI|nr:hypothetical protein [Mucilaginibacter terrae]MDT3404628.1 hypothetical protein [Mucilaginibacter terrae]
MKKIVLTLTLITAIFTYANAQTATSKACWVIESNKGSKMQLVKFYDDSLRLVYEEAINMKLNPAKDHIKKALNIILAALITKRADTNHKDILAVAFQYN